MVTKKIKLETGEDVVSVLGVQDSRLRQLEREFKVEIFIRHDPDSGGADITARGPVSRVDKALRAIKQRLAQEGGVSGVAPKEKAVAALDGAIYCPRYSCPVIPRGERQKEYVLSIFSHDMVVGVGPAGTGKTYLAVAAALRALESGVADRIVLTRPIVESGERLGFLPGDLHEKVHPYLKPLYDAFRSMLGGERLRSLMEDEIVEVVPLAYMRGRTLENSFIILDEAQNTAPEQMKMFLTRMGLNSKVVITGDITQIDIPDKKQSGLLQVLNIFKRVPAVKVVRFTKEDVSRHPLVKEILSAYDFWEAGAGASKP